jgi:hypothetical protein
MDYSHKLYMYNIYMRFWLLLFTLIFVPTSFLSAQGSNAGIVRGLWYDQEVFFAGEPIRVYVAVRNNTGADLSGAVEFYVNGERIERNFIDALDGRIVESWADWTPKYGTSTVSATLSRTEISSTASGTKSVTLTSAIAEDIIFVDLDTDKDDIGNAEDSDDDGDGVSDEDEKIAGTDPLKYNEPEKGGGENEEVEEEGGGFAVARETSNNSTEPEGLEQFFTENRAGNTLSSVTNLINTSKNKLDEYREERWVARNQIEDGETSGGEAAALPDTSTESEDDTEIGAVGENDRATSSYIGEISRNTEGSAGKVTSILNSILNGLKTITTFIYDSVLLGLSKFLSHPILVQITLLLLILFLILKLAMRFSNRQY